MPKIAVILSGSGRMDGSEIHESTLTLLYLAETGATYQCFAPDAPQAAVINHLTNKPEPGATRNQLIEAARIARGNVKPLSELKASDYDALIQPGGGGTLANLGGGGTQLLPLLKEKIRAFHSSGKPIGFICIAPLMGAMALGDKGVKLTVGNDNATAAKIEALGAKHIDCPVDDCVIDEKNKVISCPAYMLGPGIADIARGIRKLCNALVERCKR